MDFKTSSIIDIAEQSVIKKDISILVEAIKHLSIRVSHYDPNDIIVELAIIYHAASKLGENPNNFLLVQSKNCTPKLIEAIENFVNRAPEDKNIEVMGYKETNSPKFKYTFNL